MNIDKEANLGSGNIIQEFNIGTVGQLNPVATTVNNYYSADDEQVNPKSKNAKNEQKNANDMRELPPIREQIMLYVSCLTGEVSPEWKSRYMDLWNGILDVKEVAAEVYNPGKQQKTSFNRNLVANIIYYLGNIASVKTPVYNDYNATLYTEKLEGDREHSVRAALGRLPNDDIKKSLDGFMKNYCSKNKLGV